MDYRYIAGYFDADGNINVSFNPKKISFQAMFRIYSTNRKVLDEIKNFIGFGQIYLRKHPEILKSKRNIVYVYHISKKLKLKMILKKLSPFLIVKKEQVDYLLKNFNFGHNANKNFNVIEFRKSITRKGMEKQRKNKHLNYLNKAQEVAFWK